MSKEPVFYRRNLPHWQPPGATLFITWRLHDTLPESVRRRLHKLKKKQKHHTKKTDGNSEQGSNRKEKHRFRLIEQALHNAEQQAFHLKRDEIAEEVANTLFYYHEERYALHEFVIMPNHVHILLRPLPRSCAAEDDFTFHTIDRINQSIKGYTARQANRILNRTGQPFWQSESYDHWVRNQNEFNQIAHYIRMDPVRSNLVSDSTEWTWSSANPKFRERLQS